MSITLEGFKSRKKSRGTDFSIQQGKGRHARTAYFYRMTPARLRAIGNFLLQLADLEEGRSLDKEVR